MSVPTDESSLQMVIYLTAGSALCEFCENFVVSLYKNGGFSGLFGIWLRLVPIFPGHHAEF